MSRLFFVERTTQQRRSPFVQFEQYIVMADSHEHAREIAARVCPQDELDGPTVAWSVEDHAEPIAKIRSGSRRAPRREKVPT